MKNKARFKELKEKALTPEQRLCTAILCRALVDVFDSGSTVTQRNRRDAVKFFSSDSRDGLSFINCCEAVDLNAYDLRNRINKAMRLDRKFIKISDQAVEFLGDRNGHI